MTSSDSEMNLKIYRWEPENSTASKDYRGVDRENLAYVTVDVSREAHQLFWESVNVWGDSFVISDLSFCRHAVQAYARLDPPQLYEIVEITTENQGPTLAGSEFLGFDIACVYRISTLSWGLELDRDPAQNIARNDLVWVMRPLFRLIQAYFQPRLNKNGLFADYEVASFCLDAMMALQAIRPHLWESDSCKFEVVGLWRVEQDSACTG